MIFYSVLLFTIKLTKTTKVTVLSRQVASETKPLRFHLIFLYWSLIKLYLTNWFRSLCPNCPNKNHNKVFTWQKLALRLINFYFPKSICSLSKNKFKKSVRHLVVDTLLQEDGYVNTSSLSITSILSNKQELVVTCFNAFHVTSLPPCWRWKQQIMCFFFSSTSNWI